MSPQRHALRLALWYLALAIPWVLVSPVLFRFLELPTVLGREVWLFSGVFLVLVTVAYLYSLAHREISLQYHLASIARQQEADLASLSAAFMEQVAVGMAWMDRQGRLLQVNQKLCTILGCTEPELRCRDWRSFIHPGDLGIALEQLEQLEKGIMDEFSLELRQFRADGKMFWSGLTVSVANYQGDEAVHWVLMVQDITERRLTEEAIRHKQLMLSRTERIANVGSWEWDLAADRVSWSDELFRIFERDPSLGAPSFAQHDQLFSAEDLQSLNQAVNLALDQGQSYELELKVIRSSGEVRYAIARGEAERDPEGGVTHLVGSFHDITELRRSQKKLHRLAHHDTLTGLPNRVLLRQRVRSEIAQGRGFALLFLDLDRFKHVNDSLGHQVGDRLLRLVAEELATHVHANDTLSRFGGDEFVILMTAAPTMVDMERQAERLLGAFHQPFFLGEREFYLTASIGISVFPQDGGDLDALLRNADIAMYQAKAYCRNGYRFFEAAMLERVTEALRMENALRGALARRELALYYQPQVRLVDGSLAGLEALMRWHHPIFGSVSPAVFIPIAEEIGLVRELGTWALREACEQLVRWDQAGFRVPRVAVNLSVQQLEAGDFCQTVLAVLKDNHIEPQRLELEVTESLLMGSAGEAIAYLGKLQEQGVSIAIDDFGTGYSSLGYLQHLPINQLKIDKTFVEHVTDRSGDQVITRSVIALARSLDLRVLAEGVETPAQALFLFNEGCHEAQGYHFDHPLTAEQVVARWGATV